jgi:hypothetical protein
MATPLKEKVAEAMEAPNGRGKTVGDRVAEHTERGADIDPAAVAYVQDITGIQNHTDVIAAAARKSCRGLHTEARSSLLRIVRTANTIFPTEWASRR